MQLGSGIRNVTYGPPLPSREERDSLGLNEQARPLAVQPVSFLSTSLTLQASEQTGFCV